MNKSAKGADARRHTEKELREASGGEVDTATVLRVFRGKSKLLVLLLLASSASPIGSATSPTVNAYAAAYKKASWAAAVTVSYSGNCSMIFKTSGVPPSHSDYYLAPVSPKYPVAVAVSPVTQIRMSVIPYMPARIISNTVTVNICPDFASRPTAASLGPIGYMLSGEAIFNPYEGDGVTPAMTDNVSYTFTTSAGVQETASFIDSCNSHPTPLFTGYTWHHHAVPTCLAAQLDGAAGPSHLLGFALDGFPIYGGRDINGNTIPLSQLDSCNGITSVTPEFPIAAYHYVLPIGVTGRQSSLNCYAGEVSRAQIAAEVKLKCTMKGM